MSLAPKAGPFISYRAKMLGSVGTQSSFLNADEGPSLFLGSGLLDPRFQFTFSPGQRPGQNTFGFINNEYALINQVPSAIAANNIAASQSPGAGAITLVSASGAGITVNVTIQRADTGAQIVGTSAAPLLAIDTQMSPLRFGDPINGSICFWDPTKAISRAVQIVSGGNDSGINFTVNGYDLYGFPLSATLAGGNVAAVTTTKAFKYISSVTHTGSVASTVTVGTSDVIGFPMRSDFFGDLAMVYNNTWVTASTGYVAAVQTNPSTATTGDVRGTMLVGTGGIGTPTNGTIRLQLYLSPPLANMNISTNVNGLFGVTQNLAQNNGT